MFAPVAAVEAPIHADVQGLYDSAVADRRAGRLEPAADKLQRLLAENPAHVDARLNLGLVRLAQGRLDEAERLFRDVLVQAPAYTDAKQGLEAIAHRRSDARSGRVDVDYSHSRLSAGLDDWKELRVSVSRGLSSNWAGGLSAEYTERFGDRDLYLEARGDRRLSRGSVYVAAGGAPDADYRPDAALRAGADLALGAGVSATLDAGIATYAVGAVTTLQPGLATELFDGRVQLGVRWINTWDEQDRRRNGYAVRVRVQLVDAIAVRVGYADAPESSEGVTVDVKAASLGVEYALDQKTMLRLGGAHEDRGAYNRKELSIGFGRRF